MRINKNKVQCWLGLCFVLIGLLPRPSQAADERLLVTLATQGSLLILNGDGTIESRIAVGRAPWSVVTHGHRIAYVTTNEGITVIDLEQKKRKALIAYRSPIPPSEFGEYRHGGMGLAISEDGAQLYAGVYTGSGENQLEVIDTQQGRVITSFPIGTRPFDVQLSPDGNTVVSIDHDSYSVTIIDLERGGHQRASIAPLGHGAFDKPHYALFDDQGNLYLPVQGQAMSVLNIHSGHLEHLELKGNTHQHGMAWRPETHEMLIVGTGPAGGADGGPKLSLYDIKNNRERTIPLKREHEQIAVTKDGRYAWLTGGQSFTGGWDGVSRVDLETAEVSEFLIPGQPFGIALWPDR